MAKDDPHSSPSVCGSVVEGYRESWRLYRRSLEAPRGVWPQWDWVVLTAGDARQARAFELQIEWRRRTGLLPRATRFLVVPDPDGKRVGSGGATVNALGEIARRLAKTSRSPNSIPFQDRFAGKRILILHSGGESRRLPHASAFGKIFARVPRELPDGRASTLFDEFLISLAGLPFRMHEGVLIASGDVLLLFDHRQLDLSRQGVVGIAARTPAEMGTRHGVYVAEERSGIVRRFLHKAGLDVLRANGAVDAAGNVAIDTGMVWFDAATVSVLLDLFGLNETREFRPDGAFSKILAGNAPMNLYSDLLMPLATETPREAYLGDASDGRPAEAVERARPVIWEHLHGVPFRVQSLSPVEFIHFGSTAEYVGVLCEERGNRATLGWQSHVASHRESDHVADGMVLVGSLASRVAIERGHGVVEDCLLSGDLKAAGRCLLSHVWSQHAIALKPGVVLHQLPVTREGLSGAGGFVTRLFGIDDNPKLRVDDPQATFLNRPWTEWLRRAHVAPEELWETPDPEARSLWTARLHPMASAREESLARALWLQMPDEANEEIRRRWRESPRWSLAESAARADVLQILNDLKRLDDRVRVERFGAAVRREQPSREAGVLLGDRPADVRRRAAAAAKRLTNRADPMLGVRVFKALADALLGQKGNTACLEAARRCEDRAFDVLARAIRAATPRRNKDRAPQRRSDKPHRCVMVHAPARIDIAGGWSDTPPFGIEYGGAVLNAAMLLRGQSPIRVQCEVIDRPVLVLETRDLAVVQEFREADALLRYADPSDPLALHKAAVVLLGLVRREPRGGGGFARRLDQRVGGGLRVATEVNLPHGSGLGTSSILAGALLAALRSVLGRPVEIDAVFDEVLCLEQMLTTGGGWQDQVGGLVGGIKLATTRPGLPQRPRVEPLRLTPEVADALRRRLVLVYTGQRRLAKGILRAIMGRFMSRDPEVVQILCGIRDIAVAQKRAIERGDLDEVGRLMFEHWEMNKRMDPGTSTPFIDRLFEVCAPYTSGAKLAGAGGGGFMEMIVRDEDAPARLRRALADAFPDRDVSIWPSEIAPDGLVFSE